MDSRDQNKRSEDTVYNLLRGEVALQCSYALRYFALIQEVEDRLTSADPDIRREASAQLWFAVHGFLVAAANVSKLLWNESKDPAKKKRRHGRRQRLRHELNVVDNSVLKASPELRGYFDHIDEKIEEWAEESEGHSVCVALIGPPESFGLALEDILRAYEPVKRRIHFRGYRYEVMPVVLALRKLFERATDPATDPWEREVFQRKVEADKLSKELLGEPEAVTAGEAKEPPGPYLPDVKPP